MTGPVRDDRPMFPLRTVVIGTFLPTILFELGVGAMLPVIASSATALGASLATAGLVVTLMPLGQILADVPAGALAARVGDRPAMVGAARSPPPVSCSRRSPRTWPSSASRWSSWASHPRSTSSPASPT